MVLAAQEGEKNRAYLIWGKSVTPCYSNSEKKENAGNV